MKRSFLLMAALGLIGAAAAASLEIETGTAYHCTVRPATNLIARIDLDIPTEEEWKGEIVFRDYFGKTFVVPVFGRAARGRPLRVKLPEPPAMGLWRGSVKITSTKGEKVSAKSNFAVLDPHPVTPLAPRDSFRIGMNYHAIRYPPALRRQTTSAMVGIGAKLMRGDFAPMCQVETKENEFHWEKTDELIDEMLSHGIAIDAIVATVPAWARALDYVAVTNGPTWNLPMRSGLAMNYGKALAERYGTKIEYYEIGNELDLSPKSHLTVDQAMARQREFYVGIKSGCPAAKVIPCGWALADSSPWMVRQKGFQERFMSEAQDACDFHPIHVHASYEKYRKEMLKFFAWRENMGVTIPWYANESAASSCAGQEDVAAMWVWQKSLWAWAHGSVDYIWYNLRSIGNDPNNGEHMYGVFSMDMQPRATAASFSALTAVFNGLTFDKILRDSASCQLYEFTGENARILVGWDSFVRSSRKISVITDAIRCESVDIMGNRRPVELKKDSALIALDQYPMAYIFSGASQVSLDATMLGADSVRALSEVLVESSEKCPEKPSIVLDSMASYKGFCEGNAETEHRLWKGPDDLSAKVFFWKPQYETVHVLVNVSDDIATSNDHVRVVFNGEARTLAPTRTGNGSAVYEFDMPWYAIPGLMTFQIYDDDGEGLDGYMGGDDFLLKYR